MSKRHLDYVIETWGTVARYVRSVWGAGAIFHVFDRSVLIHLDRPSPETVFERIAAHAATQIERIRSSCPCCREQSEFGGDEVWGEPTKE